MSDVRISNNIQSRR